MIQRCYDPGCGDGWRKYGAKGISVATEWHAFETFYADMGATYREGLTLERKDNTEDYSKENCRWATYHDQFRNKTNNIWVDTPAGKMIVTDAAAFFKIPRTTFRRWLKQGLLPEKMGWK